MSEMPDVEAPAKRDAKSPAFQFYPKDFISSSKVQRMTLDEIGAYALLLSHCWLDDGLPTNVDQMARLVKTSASKFRRMWEGPLSECFVEKNGRLINVRLDEERRKQADYRRRAAEWGKKGGRPKGQEAELAKGSLSQPKPLQSPISDLQSAKKNEETVTRPQPIVRRRNPNAAFEGPKLYVPNATHSKFVGLRNHPGAERELLDWYEDVSNEWTNGVRRDESPGSNMLSFWDARFNEKWPPSPAATAARQDSRLPAWVVRK